MDQREAVVAKATPDIGGSVRLIKFVNAKIDRKRDTALRGSPIAADSRLDVVQFRPNMERTGGVADLDLIVGPVVGVDNLLNRCG